MNFLGEIADTESLMHLKAAKLNELQLKSEYETAKDKRIELEELVYARLEDANIQNINIENCTMYRKTNVYASVPAANKSEAFEWLTNNGYESLIQETVNAKTLSAVIKEFTAQGGETPDCIKIHVKNTIGFKNLHG